MIIMTAFIIVFIGLAIVQILVMFRVTDIEVELIKYKCTYPDYDICPFTLKCEECVYYKMIK